MVKELESCAEGLHLRTTCRTCCSTFSSEEPFTYLFDTASPAIDTSQNISEEVISFNLDITKDDGLPQQICLDCTQTFIAIKEFRERCKKVQELLFAYFRTQETLSVKTMELDSTVAVCKVESDTSDDSFCSENANEDCEYNDPSVENAEEQNPNENFYPPEHFCANIKTEVSIDEEGVSTYDLNSKPLCANCHKEFDNYEQLSTHYETCSTHSENLNFTDSNDGKDPTEIKFPCTICGNEFTDELEFVNHLQAHASNNLIACNRCGRNFSCPRALKKHFLRMHERSDHECSICKEKFTNEHRFKYHMRTHDPSKLFHCTVCGKSFMAVHHLKAHDLMHKDIRPFSCDTCDKKYRDKRSLETHMRKHSGERPYVCHICKKDFAIRTSYVLHVRKHEHAFKEMEENGGDVQLRGQDLSTLQAFPYKCSICSQGFKVAYSLAAHFDKHSEVRGFDCEECGKAFKNRPSLKQHVRLVHLKIKKYFCEFCRKKFTLPEELKSHKLIHRDEKPFKCEVCGKCFRRKNGHVAHMRVHNGDIYTCEICGKSCKSHSRLSDHIMTHTSAERQEVQRRIEEAAFKKLPLEVSCSSNVIKDIKIDPDLTE
ncbi:unnamed protein product [Hermetia illucens]|uniref:Zinc finger protein n=3 Tax=Hermetia illucens TaxID=343691 RepID=A0A7R8V649_HERIL|nr:unnamed protein product [Hermetia illucens]